MAYIKLHRNRLKENFDFLNHQFKHHQKEWAIVTKLMCGNEDFLKEILDLGIKEVCDSRIENLRVIKQIRPEVQTIFIKPPGKRNIREVVKYADVSFNSESEIIRLLNDEAGRQGVVHKVVIMIELGDLREGIMGDHLIDFYASIFELPNIKVTAIGANLNCLHGVMPSQDKMIQLSLYKQLIEAKFDQHIPFVTGGTSVVLPLLPQGQIPKSVNHFRIGETLYFGNDLFAEKPIEGMHQNVLEFFSEIIEVTEKPKVPIGTMASNPSGDVFEVDEEDLGKTSYRAIIDVGLLDISPEYLIPQNEGVEIVNASSDMLVVDLGDNQKQYKIGDMLSFGLKYMGALSLLNSDYIKKIVV